MAKGKIYLVGAGPGDPGLITVKGVEALREADCVVYDFLASEKLLDHARSGAEIIYVGKKGSRKTISQDEINDLIIRKARSGKVVVRLKGGDPFIFGRGGEEASRAVSEGIPFEVVPGVTSAVAAPAYAGIPLTHRDHSSAITFITGQENPIKERSSIAWDRLSTGRGTLVFLMGWKNLPLIRRKLLENGWAEKTPVALVRWGTMPKQASLVTTLGTCVEDAEGADILPPVVIVIGEVVKMKKELDWFETKPLFGKRVVVTRTAEQAGEFTRLLEEGGAEPLCYPTIKITPPPSWAPIDEAMTRLGSYDWCIFTSVNGVNCFFDRLEKSGRDLRELKGVRICAIGPRTAQAVKDLRIQVDLTPKKFVAESVLESLDEDGVKGKRFLLPRALVAREILPEEIRRLGGFIDVCPVYKTVRPRKNAEALREVFSSGGADVVTFTSSSTVTNFAAMFRKGELPELMRGVKVACIGPITADTARGFGLEVDIMPKRYTIPDLTEAMAEYFKAAPEKRSFS